MLQVVVRQVMMQSQQRQRGNISPH